MAIDEALRQRLEERGRFDAIKELEGLYKSSKLHRNFPSIKDVAATTGRILTPIGESMGAALSTKDIQQKKGRAGAAQNLLGITPGKGANTLQEEVTQRNIELSNSLIKQLRNPKISRDRKLLTVRQFSKINPDIISQVPELQETALQTLGKGGETAMTTGLLLSGIGNLTATGPASKAIVNFNKFSKTFGKGPKVGLFPKVAGNMLRGGKAFLGGSLFGSAFALSSGKEDPKEIAKEAATMGVFNLAAPAVISKGLKISGLTAKTLGKTVTKGIAELNKRFTKIASKIPARTGNWLMDTSTRKVDPLGRTLAAYGEKATQSLLDFPKTFKTAFTDRLAPIESFVKKVQTRYPQKRIINTGNDAYMRARNYAGIDGRFVVAKSDFDKMLTKYKGMEDEVFGYVKGMDLLTRLQRGQAVEGSVTLKEINTQLLDIEKRITAKHGEKGLDMLMTGVNDYSNFVRDKILMKEFVEGDLVKREVANKWVRENPNYMPHDVLDFIENKAVGSLTKGGDGFSVADSGIKAAKGSTRELATVYDATMNRLSQAQRLAERNRIANEVIELGKKDLQYFGFQKVTGKTKPVDIKKQGLEKISLFKNGELEEWLIPEDLGASMKNMGRLQLPAFLKWITLPQRTLRNFATRFNPSFTLSNFPRDLQTAAGITEKGLPKKNLFKALNDVTDFDNPNTRNFFEEGGALAGLIGAEKPSKDLLAASRRAKTFNVIPKVGELVEAVGERFENSTRFAVYLDEVGRGLSPAEAAFNARNATVDFAKSGNVMRVLNQFIPFLNARTQGMLNIGKALQKDPSKFVRRQFNQSVYPSMLLYSNNRNYESYKNIPPFEWQNNWIIMTGETDGFDSQGRAIKVPEYVKIKKGEFQAPAANAVEEYFRMSNEENPQQVGEFMRDMIGAVSPIGAGSGGPLTIPFELTSNYNLFTGRSIEPDWQEIVPGGKKLRRENVPAELKSNRWNGSTSKFLSEKFGKNLGLSPARIEFILGKLFATPGKDLLFFLDSTQEGIDRTGVPQDKASTYQILSKFPGIRSFVGSNAAGESMMLYDKVEKIKKEQVVPREIEKELEAYTNWLQLKSLEENGAKEEANAAYKEFDKDMKKRLNRMRDNNMIGKNVVMTVYEGLSSNDEKVRFLVEVLNEVQTKEEKNKLIKEFQNFDLISKNVLKGLTEAKEKGILNLPE